MENSEPTEQVEQDKNEKNSGPIIIFIVTFILVAIALWQFSGGKTEKRPMDSSELLKDETVNKIPLPEKKPDEGKGQVELEPVIPAPEVVKPIIEDLVIEPIITLPALDNSDSLIQAKLPELTWRNELLSLLITEDIVRRFVVFTDNFAQGLLAYEHTPFSQPKMKFSVDEETVDEQGNKGVWKWNTQNSKRFDLYVDLLRSVDSATLVNMYFEVKPLIDEAYSELGYEEDFTYTLQDAVTRVLDMELPKSSMALTRTSVMYKYQDPKLEGLTDSDKLLLRIGKENLLIVKSVLLEINEKLTQKLEEKKK
jgi:hypothetical protein